jgi:hypothetical protein
MTNYIYNPINLNNIPPKLSMYGLSDDVFTVYDRGNNFTLDTRLVFLDSKPGIPPETVLLLRINNDTSKILFFTDAVWLQNITKFYHIIYDANASINGYTSDKIACIEYTYNNSTKVLNSNIISNGKLTSNKYLFNQELLDIYQGAPIASSNLNTEIKERNSSDFYINNIIGYSVKNVNILASGVGYKLNSTFFLHRSDLMQELLPDDCVLSAYLYLCYDTVTITGGVNYKVGDRFTINNVNSTGCFGLIQVTETNSIGSILRTELINPGCNFTSLPTVTDNSSSGSGALIVVKDSFGIDTCQIIDAGNGYIPAECTIGCKLSDIEYQPSVHALATVQINQLDIVPLLNNNFSIDAVSVIVAGNNISEVQFNLINNNNIINNTYISVNNNNLVKTQNTGLFNRPRFFI